MIDGVAGSAPEAGWRGSVRVLFRISPPLLLALVFAAVLASGVWRHLSLHDLAAQRAVLKGFVRTHPVESVAIYLTAYGLVVALSIPGALFMTLSGGFLFGVWLGGGAAVVGVTCGAVVMFLAAHTALGDSLRRITPADGLIRRLENGVRRNAVCYLLFLRLMPAAPIWLVNIAAAFVRVPLWLYAATTAVGVAPSTFIYAGIGSSLDQVFAAGGVPDLRAMFQARIFVGLLALSLLALAPVAYQAWHAHRRRVAEIAAVK